MRTFLLTVLCWLIGASAGAWVIQHTHTSGGGAACASGGSIGTTTRNSSASYANNRFQYSTFTPDAAGTITHCWVRYNNISSGQGVTIGVYDSDGNILGYYNFSNSGTTEAWKGGGPLNNSVCLVGGETYYIGMVTQDASWNFFFDSSEAGVGRFSIGMTYGTTLANADFSSPTSHGADTAYMTECNDTGTPPA